MDDGKVSLYLEATSIVDPSPSLQYIGAMIVDRSDPNTTLSWSQLYHIASLLLNVGGLDATPAQFYIKTPNGTSYAPSSDPVHSGTYHISPYFATTILSITTLSAPRRFISGSKTGTSSSTSTFRGPIRLRDAGCVLRNTRVNPLKDPRTAYSGYECAHIVPRSLLAEVWLPRGFYHHITNLEDKSPTAKINSDQNGIMLSSDLHAMFDAWKIGIDVDVGCFLPDPFAMFHI